jgi:hypothetical protein
LVDRALVEVFREMNGGMFPPMTETFERGKTIFFPGDPAERFYFLVKGAVKLSRVYEAGEEITVALLRENSVFGAFITQLHLRLLSCFLCRLIRSKRR